MSADGRAQAALPPTSSTRKLPAWFLLVCVGVSGAAVMILELTAVRAMQPFFGSTTPVWSNVIATALGALSVGYALGGRVADFRPQPTIYLAFLAVAGRRSAGRARSARRSRCSHRLSSSSAPRVPSL
jgi:hypothetical protein